MTGKLLRAAAIPLIAIGALAVLICVAIGMALCTALEKAEGR